MANTSQTKRRVLKQKRKTCKKKLQHAQMYKQVVCGFYRGQEKQNCRRGFDRGFINSCIKRS
jgi:hypothetical protein